MVAKNKRQRHSVSAWMDRIKESRPCLDCGGYFPACVMDWDHRPGETKATNVSDLVRHGSRRLAEAEIKKCDLRCSNCHRIRTHLRRLGATRPLDRFLHVHWERRELTRAEN
jgi:hypothetical protein